jgi:hypothetical protein
MPARPRSRSTAPRCRPTSDFRSRRQIALRYSRFIRDDLIGVIRADEWWDYKLVPILSAFYATAVVLHVAVISLWAGALSLLLAIAAAAVYASAINERTDRADDVAAGKRNRAAEQPRSVAALLAVAVAAGLAFAWLWRADTPLLSCYLATWLAFALYSIPPFRLKKRGLAGVLCDAAGEQLFPALAAVLIACRSANRAVSGTWLVSVGVFALAFGLRGIIWHQLIDIENDRAASISTFALRNPDRAARIGHSSSFRSSSAHWRRCSGRSASHGPPRFSRSTCCTPFAARAAGT